MKRLALASVLISVGAYAVACSSPEPATGSGGGTALGGTSGVSNTGGAAGSSTQGGASGSGVTGGTTGSGGTTPTGGAGGDGTVTGGAGGIMTGGSGGDGVTGGAGGMTGGSGGDGVTGGAGGMTGGTAGQGMGGAGMGGMGMGGKGGTGGMGGSAGGGKGTCPTVAELFPTSGNLGSLDGRLVTTPCADTNSDDCTGGGWIYNGVTTPCMGNLTAQQDFAVGGTPGTQYTVNIHFYGITEPKNYGSNVTREAGQTRPSNADTGAATPAPWAYTTSAGAKQIPLTDYNTYELHVLDNTGAVYRQYFVNSDTSEGHWTYIIDYARNITVIGGGKVRFRQYDNNCRMIKNCWGNNTNGPASQCATKARTVPNVTQAMPPPPASFMQPGLGNDNGNSGQWVYTDVVSVTCN